MANAPHPSDNPFAPPSAPVTDIPESIAAYELATRGSRLAAVIIDALPFVVLGLLIVISAGSFQAIGSLNNIGEGMAISFGVAVLLIGAIDIYLLAKRGQTIGKLAMKIRIVRSDGSRAGFWRIFLLRILLNSLITGIPFVGSIYWLVDILMIFRESHKCLHDQIADTIVVKA